ncbi:alpha/beta fold hydrolase [Microcystis aeruginosa]|uniref:Alpha/beta hydrolase fold protein n=1 Tax=Microcystis aeruginosa PCC 9443 TaxID=1160281 RepID=I4GA21_MICAE|nr:alpha/beta hydrolase [Microcystis aeruginosa]CCI04782.1 Alpha/beta hydrolase fold protein [Microcystis aeruginosa PCC 9443]
MYSGVEKVETEGMVAREQDLLTGKWVDLRTNVRFKVCHQAGKTPAIVFLHGGLGNRFNWRYQYEFFAHRGREVLVYDLAGHGDSTPYTRYSLGRHCRDLTRLLEIYGLQEPILCCHSYGVPLGLEWAIQNQVKGMILIAGGTHDLDPWWEVPMMKTMKWLGRHLFHFPLVQNISNYLSTSHNHELINRFLQESPVPKEIHAYEALEIFWGYNFFERHQSREVFQNPVLVITGGEDPTFNKNMGDNLTDYFPQGNHFHLERAGHLLIAEYADIVNQVIANWCQSL